MGAVKPLLDPPKALGRNFYARKTLEVASGLLGATLVRRFRSGYLAGRIVEVEAYVGEDDPACHALHGRTKRTDVMYGPPGHAYVYFTYGMHFMLNVVTEAEGFPAAVLIRALEPLAGLALMRRRRGGVADRHLTSGPARLCEALGIDLKLNRTDLIRGPLYIAAPETPVHATRIQWTARIGIRNGIDRPWRCFESGNPFVSKGRPGAPPSKKKRHLL